MTPSKLDSRMQTTGNWVWIILRWGGYEGAEYSGGERRGPNMW
jgi:hypothetical protein